MGEKFANLQVQGLSVSEAQKLLSNSCAKQYTNGWTTVVRDDFQIGLIDQEARKLSKKIDKLVISVGYYDDDILTLNLFRNGKSIVSHISNNAYGYNKKEGNPSTFVKELNLSTEYQEYFKWVLKCDNPERKVELLEKLLGIPLSLNYETIDDFNETECKNDIDYIKQYIENIKKSEKIKNITTIKLLMEIEGYSHSVNGKYFLINHPNNDGRYYSGHSKLYTTQSDGPFSPFLKDASICFEDYIKILVNDKLIAVFYPGETNIASGINKNSSVSFYTMDGDKISNFDFDERNGRVDLLLANGSIIFSNPIKEKIVKYNVNGNKIWELTVGYLHVQATNYNDYILLHYSNRKNNKAEILKINQMGDVEAKFELMPRGGCHWRKFLFDKQGYIYYCCSIVVDDGNKTYLLCFDEDLNKVAELELSGISFQGLIDTENDKIYVQIFEKELLVIDINSIKISARKKCDDDIHLCCIDNKGRLVTQKGSSTIEILDLDLNIVSRHRLKGDIISFYKNSSNNVCVVTSNFACYFGNGKADKCMLWINEIVLN